MKAWRPCLAAARAGIIGMCVAGCCTVDSQVDVGVKNVPYVTLNNGMEMPQPGFGTSMLKDETATKAVAEAVRQGYRLIDTAQGYGNEAAVYQGIKASGILRAGIFITTQVNTTEMRENKVRESPEQSLANLGGEYIDLVLIHWPVKGEVESTWKIMEEYVKAGKIRAIGLSNFNPRHINELLKYATIKPVINQIEIHPYLTQRENAGYTFAQNIQVEGWSPLGSGRNGVFAG